MENLETVKFNLNEKQFTQLGYDLTRKKFYVSVYFRFTNRFSSVEFEKVEKALEFYEEIK